MIDRRTVFSTHWFRIVAKTIEGCDPDYPYFSLQTLDYVSVLAVTERDEIILVRQFRPAVDEYTLELPSGHVEEGESPEQAARRELEEETGYRADTIELLGSLMPDTGRMSNRLWCFFAVGVLPVKPATDPELETIHCTKGRLMDYIEQARFAHASNLAALFLAVIGGKLTLDRD